MPVFLPQRNLRSRYPSPAPKAAWWSRLCGRPASQVKCPPQPPPQGPYKPKGKRRESWGAGSSSPTHSLAHGGYWTQVPDVRGSDHTGMRCYVYSAADLGARLPPAPPGLCGAWQGQAAGSGRGELRGYRGSSHSLPDLSQLPSVRDSSISQHSDHAQGHPSCLSCSWTGPSATASLMPPPRANLQVLTVAPGDAHPRSCPPKA